MKIIDDLKVYLAKKKIGKIVNHRSVQFFNLANIKSINILYYFSEPLNIEAKGQYKEIFELLSDLRERGIKCEFTFFVKDSIVEAKRVNMTALTKDNFSRWTYSPNDTTYTNFMVDESDVLLNLSPVTCWPIEYLAQYSTAKFKIAIQREEQGAKYDFLFKPSDNTSFPLDAYKQIINYLDVINQ